MIATLARCQPLLVSWAVGNRQQATRATCWNHDNTSSSAHRKSTTDVRQLKSVQRRGRTLIVKAAAQVSSSDTGIDIPVTKINDIFWAPGDVLTWTPNSSMQHGVEQVFGKSDNGNTLAQNKGIVMHAARNASDSEKALILAMAMQETKYMDGYDYTKDGAGLAANVSCLNLNVDMLNRAGWDCAKWVSDKDLNVVVESLLKWFRGQVPDQKGRTDHVKDTLNFVRGGATAFFDKDGWFPGENGRSNAYEYRNAIASIYRELRTNATHDMFDDHEKHVPNKDAGDYIDSKNLWSNNTRIWILVPHV